MSDQSPRAKTHYVVVMPIKNLRYNAKSSDQSLVKVWTGLFSMNLCTDPLNHFLKKSIYHVNQNKRQTGKKIKLIQTIYISKFSMTKKKICILFALKQINLVTFFFLTKKQRKCKSKLLRNCWCQLSSFSPLSFIQKSPHLGRLLWSKQPGFQSPRTAPHL